jgi:hypothetical protein
LALFVKSLLTPMSRLLNKSRKNFVPNLP